MKPRAEKKPDWSAVTYEALIEPSSLMRVLAGMQFPKYIGPIPRGAVFWWVPGYLSAPKSSPHRATFAAVNRNMRDAPVHLLRDGKALFAVCSYAGEWRTADGAQRGSDLPSLGALRWRCGYGQAAARIARLIGLDPIPLAAPVATDQIWREVHARLREPVHASEAVHA